MIQELVAFNLSTVNFEHHDSLFKEGEIPRVGVLTTIFSPRSNKTHHRLGIVVALQYKKIIQETWLFATVLWS